MWELRNKLSRGRISLRRFSLLVTSVLMTFFVATSAFTKTAYAADAIRNNNTVTYQGNTYSVASQSVIDAAKPSNAPSSTSGYYYADTQAKKAYFIFTTGTPADANSGYYVTYDYSPPNTYTNASSPADVTITNSTSGGATSNCSDSAVTGIGWIVCPIVTFLAKGMDMIYNLISSFLEVKTVTNDTSTSIYRLWAIVRDLANICFVIAFLIIVYSQITSLGISNYGIKHMLPRLIVGAILVNVSYWICAIGVDVSNILGASVHSVFDAVMKQLNTGAQYDNVTVPTWETMSAAALSGGAAVTAAGVVIANNGVGTIYLLLPILLAGLLAIFVALVILAARQALITCLIIIAPLAMVAYILPNTEKYFEKWRSSFMTLLLLFPIFSVIFSGAQLAGLAIVQNADGNILTIILGMAVQVAPIVITPLLIKFSGGIIGKLAGIVNNPNKGLIDRTRNWSQGKAQEHRNKVLSSKTSGRKIHAGMRALDTRRRKIEGRRKAYEAGADNRFAATRQGQDIEAMNRGFANDKQHIDNTFADSARGRHLELQSRHLGVQKQEIENSTLDNEAGRQLTQRQRLAEIEKSRVENNFEDSEMGRQVDRAKRVVEANKRRIQSDHETHWNTAVQTDAGLKEVELGTKASEVKAALAKGQVDKMHSEIVAEGEESEHVIHLRGANATTQEHVLNFARSIKADSFDTQLTGMAKNMAERKIKEQVARNLSKTAAGDLDLVVQGTDTPIHVYAGGIMGDVGVNSIVAKAKTDFSSVIVDNIKNVKNTMDYTESTNVDKLLQKFTSNNASMEDRIAYAWTMSERGGPGNVALRKAIDFMDQQYANDQENSDFQGFKELLASMSGAMKSGKDIEFWLTNTRDKDGDLRTLRSLSNDKGTWNALQVESFVGMNMISQLKALRTYARDYPDLYNKLVQDIKRNDASYAQLKPAVKNAMEFAPDAIDPSDSSGTRGYWSDEAIRLRASNPELDFNDPW